MSDSLKIEKQVFQKQKVGKVYNLTQSVHRKKNSNLVLDFLQMIFKNVNPNVFTLL